ncbi:hypothetical protein OS965_38845 [Streptomyces sp. H27-G5]|uniref:hypothetical protein n=1 Tax=Streptomyces sp. H27-G5 TaxID=2996698 RepID=UPI0022712A3F|nr:hypothetical protein [Streptomyces sp. H27-G5]MCY0924016.1 hypothetical protein [Streptomyces sp. H27-G5]
MNPFKSVSAQLTAAKERRELRAEEEARQSAARKEFESRHRLRLSTAAAVSSVVIVCHEDTWAFVERLVFPGAGTGFHIPFHGSVDPKHFPGERCRIERGTGMATVTVSGPHLVRCLTIFRAVLAAGSDHVLQDAQRYAMSKRLYARFSGLVDSIDPDTSSGAVPRLVIDAGLDSDGKEADTVA